MTYDEIFSALIIADGAAFVSCLYYSIRFLWKLQDARMRGLIPRSLVPTKAKMDLIWMINVGDIVPGAATYRRRCIISLVIAVGLWLCSVLLAASHHP